MPYNSAGQPEYPEMEGMTKIEMRKRSGGEAPKPAMEGKSTPANIKYAKIEKSHQGTGPGWNTRRPKAGS